MSLPKADIDRMGRASRKLYNKGIGTLSRRYDYAFKLLAKINKDVKSSEQKILTTKYVNKKILQLDIAGLYKLYNERNYAIWLAIRYVIVCQTYPKATFKGDTDLTTPEQWERMFPQFKGIFDFDSIVQEWNSFIGISGAGLESVATGAIELIGSAIAGAVALGTAIDEANRPPEGGSGGAAVNLQAPASIYTSNVPPIEELENRHRRLRETINVSRMDSIFAGEYEVAQTNAAFMTEEEIMRQRERMERDSLQILEELLRLYDEREDIEDEERRNVLEVQIQMELHKLRELLNTYSTPELIETLSVFRRFSADKEKIGYREMQQMQDEINSLLRQRVRDVNVPEGGPPLRKTPLSTDLRDVLLKLLTLPNSIIQIPQSIFNVAFKGNIYMWAEIGALLNEVLGNDDFVNYLLRMPSRKKDAIARAGMINEIVKKLMSATGEKLNLLRTLNDILLYHLTKENIFNPSFKDSDRAKIAKALGIRPEDLTQKKYLKYITDRMIQDPKKDAATEQPEGNIGLYDKDVIEPLIARVYERFYATGVLSVEQAQEFTMSLIQSVNSTTDFGNLKQLLSEEEPREMTSGQLSPEYTLAKDEAIGRVIDTLNEILNEFNDSLKKVIIDPKKIYELVKEAMAQFKAQVGGSLIDKMKKLKDVFKGIEDKQLKKYPIRPVPTPEPEPVPTPEPEPRYPEDPSEIEMQEVQERIRLEERPDSLTSRGLRTPLPLRKDPRLRAALNDIHRQIYNNPLGVDSRAISNTLIDLAREQVVVQGAGFTVNGREWAEGDEPPEDPSTPLEIIDNRTGRRWRTTVGRIVALAVFLSGVGVGIWEIFQIIKDGVDDIPPIPPIKPDPPIPPKPPVPPEPPIPPEPPVPPEPVPPVNPTPSDDPSSWINKPPDEGDILITAINPAESYLFNSTQKQKEDEYERFREFSMVPPADLENPLVFDAYMSQNRRFRNTYPNPKVPPMKYVDIKRNRQPQFQDVRFDVLNRKKDMFQRQDSFYTDCGFTREIQQDPFVQDYRRSNYFPDRAVLGQPQDAYRGDKSLQWINNDGADRFSRKDRWYEGSYDGQREVDKTLYKSKRYNFTIDRFYSRKQR